MRCYNRSAAAASLLGVLLLCSCSADGSWDLLRGDVRALGWGRRIALVIDNTLQAETLVDFPLLVTLDPSRIAYGDLAADGADLGFYGESMEALDFEVEQWNPGGTSRIWVRVPSIPGGATARIWMYYSSKGQAPRQNPAGVWRGGFAAVWHLNEPGGSAGCVFRDSSGNGCDGIGGYFSQSPPVGEPGWIGNGQRFGVTGMEGFGIPGTLSLDDLGPVTWSFWLLDPGPISLNGDRFFATGSLRIWVQGLNLLKIEVDYLSPAPNTLLKEYANAWVKGAWQCLAMSWDGGPLHAGVSLYRNGAIRADTNRHNAAGTRVSDAGSVPSIGNGNWAAANRSFGQQSIGAVLDEVRISRTVRSADWIRADYLSMTDGLLSYSLPETVW